MIHNEIKRASISIPEFKLKRLIVALLLLSPVYVAWPQIKAGSVVYVDFAKDELTIAADSRMIQWWSPPESSRTMLPTTFLASPKSINVWSR
jgi:hypothetical protein